MLGSMDGTECNVADVVADPGVGALQLEWRFFVREEDLWCRVRGSPSLAQLLQEYFAQNDVVLVAEHGAEDDRHPVRFGLDVHGLFVAVVDHSLFVAFFTCTHQFGT